MSVPCNTTSGTQALTQNAEFSVARGASFNAATPKTTSGSVTIWLDFRSGAGGPGGNGPVAGDNITIRLYRSIAGGTLSPDDVATAVPGTIWTRDVGLVGGNWDATVTLTTATPRSIGYEVNQNIGDVNVASWLGTAPAAPTVAGIPKVEDATMQARIDATRAAKIDQLDAAVTSRATASDVASAIAASVAAIAAAAAGAVWSTASEGTETMLQVMRLLRARAAGKRTVRDGDGSYVWRDAADTKPRIAMTRTGADVTVTTADGA